MGRNTETQDKAEQPQRGHPGAPPHAPPLVPPHWSVGVQTKPATPLPLPFNLGEEGDSPENHVFTPHIARHTLFPAHFTQAHPGPPTWNPITRGHSHIHVQILPTTNDRHISIPQVDDEDSIMTSKLVDALLDQVKNLIIDSSKFLRAKFLRDMTDKEIYVPWAVTVQPYPPFIQSNNKFLNKIQVIRQDAVIEIQHAAVRIPSSISETPEGG